MSAFDMEHKPVKQHQKDMHTYKTKQARQTRQEKTSRAKTKEDKTKQDKTRQNNTKQGKIK
jgi:hypothetical protein